MINLTKPTMTDTSINIGDQNKNKLEDMKNIKFCYYGISNWYWLGRI